MSLNFNFSGLFGGTPSLDRSKFDFSAYAPQTEQPTQTATAPEPEVRYSNTVQDLLSTATPSNSETAMTSLENNLTQPIDMGMNFGVAPITPVVPTNDILNSTATGFDVNAGAVDDLIEGKTNNTPSNLNVIGNPAYSLLDGKLGSNNDIAGINDYLNSEEFKGYVSEYDNKLSSLGDYKRAGGATTNLLNQAGLPKALGVQGEYGGYKNYTYNSETNQYELTGDTEKSAFEAAAPQIAQTAFIAAATAGVGTALSGTSAIQSAGASLAGAGATTAEVAAAAQGIGQAVSAAAVTAAQGGDLQDVVQNAALGGLGGYADGLAAASEAANAAAGVIGATAEAANHAAALASQLDVVNTIQSSIKLAEAIDQKDLLGVVSSGLDLAGMDSLQTYAEGRILSAAPDSEFLVKHADELAAAAIKVTDKLVAGEDLDDAVKSGLTTYVKEGGGLGGLLPDIDLGDGLDIDILPEEFIDWVKTTASDINRDVIQPVVDTVVTTTDEVVRALPTTKQDWEDAEQGIKDVASDTASVVREVGRDVREFADPLANDVRQVGRDIRNIDFPDVSLPSFDLPSFSLPSGGGGSIGDADLVNITLSDPELVKGFDYATLNNPLTNKRVI